MSNENHVKEEKKIESVEVKEGNLESKPKYDLKHPHVRYGIIGLVSLLVLSLFLYFIVRDTPSSVAEKMILASADHDFETICELSYVPSKELDDCVKEAEENAKTLEEDPMMKDTSVSVDILGVYDNVRDNSADVIVVFESTTKLGDDLKVKLESQSFDVLKKDGHWIIEKKSMFGF